MEHSRGHLIVLSVQEEARSECTTRDRGCNKNQLQGGEETISIFTDAAWNNKVRCLAGVACKNGKIVSSWLRKGNIILNSQAEAETVLLASSVAISKDWSKVHLLTDSQDIA